MIINIYCDESCHLMHDNIPIMSLGAIQYPEEKVREFSKQISLLKKEYNCQGELKWTKVSNKNLNFYLSLIDLFMHEKDLHFRSLIVHNKENLDHESFNENNHDNFYYKMYFYLLRNIIENKPDDFFNVYLDIKDTKSSLKVKKLKEVLSNNFYDFTKKKINRIQQIRSHESNLLQLCDFILGAITYLNKHPQNSNAKLHISNNLSQKTGFSLKGNTPPWEQKFNLFHFTPRGGY